jgi:hypothetical protein
LKFRVALRMGISARNQERASIHRRVHEASDIRNDFLGAGHVQLASRQHEIGLDVHFPENNFLRCHAKSPRVTASLFYRRAADSLANLFEGFLKLLAVANGIQSLSVDLSIALRKPCEARDASFAQGFHWLRGQ